MFLSCSSYGQGEGNIWYFGQHIELDFNGGSPVPLTDGALFTEEGCTSISDANGNLLFYTDGQKVWNKNHLVMPNGTGLLGHHSASQAAVIVPYPGNNNLYYVFTTTWVGGAFAYSLVDMSLDGGLGDVVVSSKNIVLIPNSTEKIAAVLHSNGYDVWVLAHATDSNAFYAYLITTTGLVTSPIISSVGMIHPTGPFGYGCVGYMRVSPDGSKVATALNYEHDWELFDFDKSTGIVSNPMTFLDVGHQTYGIEFSPDGQRIYISQVNLHPEISQYDLSLSSFTDIETSQTTIFEGSDGEYGGALQLGPDGKIYFSRAISGAIGVIHKPNELGTACDYEDNAISFPPNQARVGLPDFIQSYFMTAFTWDNDCLGIVSNFTSKALGNVISYAWDFGDPSSPNNTSTLANPSHNFTSAGTFTVTLTVTFANGISKTYDHNIRIWGSPIAGNITGEDTVCLYNTLTYVVDTLSDASWYEWELAPGITSTSGSLITESNSIELDFASYDNNGGVIRVRGGNDCFDGAWSPDFPIYLPIPEKPTILNQEDSLCLGDSLLLQVSPITVAQNYVWVLSPGIVSTTGESDTIQTNVPELWVEFTGTVTGDMYFSVWAKNLCYGAGEQTENYHFTLIPFLEIPDIPEGKLIVCKGDSGILYIVNPVDFADYYLWEYSAGISPSSGTNITTNPEINLNFSEEFETGTLVLRAINYCDEVYSEILEIGSIPRLQEPIISDSLCNILFTQKQEGVHYQWYRNDELITDAHDYFYQTKEDLGNYKVIIKNPCEVLESPVFDFDKSRCATSFFLPEAFSPNGDGVNDLFEIFGLNVGKVDVRIYNRWGEVIYILKNLDDFWDGKDDDNIPVPVGLYIYQGYYHSSLTDERFEVQGKIHLLR